MAKELPQNLTRLANDAQRDPEAARLFLSAVYEVLREIAQRNVGGNVSRGEAVAGATEVAHEVAADLLKPGASIVYVNRQHVFGGLVTRIRHKLIDMAKGRRRAKRGGNAAHVSVDSPAAMGASGPTHDPVEVMAIEEALAKLATEHPNAHRVVMLRGEQHTVQEIADVLDVSPKTVVRWSEFARAFLYGALRGRDTNSSAAKVAPDPHDRSDR